MAKKQSPGKRKPAGAKKSAPRKKATRRKPVARKKPAARKPAARKRAPRKAAPRKVARKPVARRKAPRGSAARRGAAPRSAGRMGSAIPTRSTTRGLGPEAGGQSGDIEGLSRAEMADSESVEELVEEGQAFEAGIVDGVENAPDADEGGVRTRQVPEDDVPQEYLDED